MKQKIIIAIIFFIIGGVGGCFLKSNFIGTLKTENKETVSKYSEDIKEDIKTLEEDIEEDTKLNQQESLARIDYPLIDIYFMDDKEYRVELTKYMQDKIYKEYTDGGGFFQKNKGGFSILTVPTGMGTTPQFSLSIYEDEECIKTINCVKVRMGVLDGRW